MARIPVILHERLGVWARQLRPRLVGWPIRWAETRSAADLETALAGSACPIVVIDLGGRPRLGLDDLIRALRVAPNALLLVLDPGSRAGVASLARELGATEVIAGMVAPPAVAQLLARWLPLSRRRAEADGWADDPEPSVEPWELLAAP